MARVDVVVPTRNNSRELEACLRSLAAQTTSDIRPIVCVDGSTDGTMAMLGTLDLGIPITVRSHPGNAHRGRAATRNLALPIVDSEVVLFCDSDMRLEPDAIEQHLRLLRARSCASVGSVAYTNRGENLWATYISARRLNRYRAGEELPHSQFLTANVALATEDFVTLGGFDEAIAGYGGEDVEFGYRFGRITAKPIVANPSARAQSTESKSLAVALRQLEEYGATNLIYIHNRHPEMPHTFGTDRLTSKRLRDRLFVAAMNPATDALAKILVPRVPFAVQHILINYMVVRAVARGFAAGARG